MSNLLEMPDDVWNQLVLHLDVPDILNLLSSSRQLHDRLGKNQTIWRNVFERDSESSNMFEGIPFGEVDYRLECKKLSHKQVLPAVKWYVIRQSHGISPREGHIACVFHGADEDRMCVTGGFVNDRQVHVLRAPREGMMNESEVPMQNKKTKRSWPWKTQNQARDKTTWTWHSVLPTGPNDFVYGASLTTMDETRAVRFGGFQSGGYTGETNQVAVLTVNSPITGELSASWEVMAVSNRQFGVARAYHTATLVAKRYLVILGGMTTRGSILSEAILDTQTWAFLDPSTFAVLPSHDDSTSKPSGRHGHSVVLDAKRSRLVLFGGGSGTNLLHSGVDNTEVWELKMGKAWDSQFEDSFPWTWRRLHNDIATASSYDTNQAESKEQTTEQQSESLTQVEALCLGRCHQTVRVARDMVLILFGSRRPSTNGILAFNLGGDMFLRPRVLGSLPRPRFTFVSGLLHDRYILVYGGYSAQEGTPNADMNVLDLTPILNKASHFERLPISRVRERHAPVSDADILAISERHSLGIIFGAVSYLDDDARFELFSNLLDRNRGAG